MNRPSDRGGRRIALSLIVANCTSEEHACIDGREIWERRPSEMYCVRGDLVVQGRKDQDLAYLTRAVGIEGSLLVHDNPALEELPGMPALEYLEGNISISKNTA